VDRRSACHAGSPAYVDQCAAEIGGIERGGIHQGQECNSCGAALLKRERNTLGSEFGPEVFSLIRVGGTPKHIAEQEREDRRLDQLEMPEITRE
jgi:hypothetical protein